MTHAVQWETEMAGAQKRAIADKRPILLDFYNPG